MAAASSVVVERDENESLAKATRKKPAASKGKSEAVTARKKPVTSGSCGEEDQKSEAVQKKKKTKSEAVQKKKTTKKPAAPKGKPREAARKTQKMTQERIEATCQAKTMRRRRSVIEKRIHSYNADTMGLPMAAPTRDYLPDNERSMSASHYQESLDGQLLATSADAPSIRRYLYTVTDGRPLLEDSNGTVYKGGLTS